MAEYDAAVVGSGPNGLMAAIRLAEAGARVVVLERAATAGGGVRTAELTEPGFKHDVCSSIHPMVVAAKAGLGGLPLEEHGLAWVHPDVPVAHPLDDAPAAVLYRGMGETSVALDDGGRWAELFMPFVRHWEALFTDAMGPLPAPPNPLPQSPLLLSRFGLVAFQSARGLAKRLHAERGRALLAGIAGHSVLPLERTPSAAIALMLGIAGHAVGWPFPRGGAQAIVDAAVSHLRSLGGDVVLEHDVAGLGDVPTDGPIVFDVGPHALARIAGDALPAGYRRRLEGYRYGPGVFKIDYALSGPIPWKDPACAGAGTVHLGGTFDEIAASEAAACRGEVPQKPYVLVAQTSPFDPSRAPAGKHTGWAYCHVPAGSDADMTAAIEAQLERFAPGFRDVVIARHIMNAPAYEAYNPNNVGGDVIGGVSDLGQLFTRPVARANPYATPNPRLFLGSASTPPGGGVHGLCGHFAAKAAIRRHF